MVGHIFDGDVIVNVVGVVLVVCCYIVGGKLVGDLCWLSFGMSQASRNAIYSLLGRHSARCFAISSALLVIAALFLLFVVRRSAPVLWYPSKLYTFISLYLNLLSLNQHCITYALCASALDRQRNVLCTLSNPGSFCIPHYWSDALI